jgi:Mg2+-importing ATPase
LGTLDRYQRRGGVGHSLRSVKVRLSRDWNGTLIIHIIRTRRLAFIESHASVPLLLTGLAACSVGGWLTYSPFAGALGFQSLPAFYWPLLAVILLTYLVLTHLMKIWFHRRFGLD